MARIIYRSKVELAAIYLNIEKALTCLFQFYVSRAWTKGPGRLTVKKEVIIWKHQFFLFGYLLGLFERNYKIRIGLNKRCSCQIILDDIADSYVGWLKMISFSCHEQLIIEILIIVFWLCTVEPRVHICSLVIFIFGVFVLKAACNIFKWIMRIQLQT